MHEASTLYAARVAPPRAASRRRRCHAALAAQIDPWWLEQHRELHEVGLWLRTKKLGDLDRTDMVQLKRRGFSDAQIARAVGEWRVRGSPRPSRAVGLQGVAASSGLGGPRASWLYACARVHVRMSHVAPSASLVM